MHILFSFGAPFRVALIMVYAATSMAAHAGAWVPRKGEGKLILNQIEQRQDEANVVRFRHKEIYQSLLLEYGLSEAIGIAAKRGVQKRFLPQGKSRTDETRFGITFNAPAIATGLLPPYFYGLAKKMLPLKNIQREKRASMTLGWLDDETQYWSALAQGDRISVGRLRVTQEVSFACAAKAAIGATGSIALPSVLPILISALRRIALLIITALIKRCRIAIMCNGSRRVTAWKTGRCG